MHDASLALHFRLRLPLEPALREGSVVVLDEPDVIDDLAVVCHPRLVRLDLLPAQVRRVRNRHHRVPVHNDTAGTLGRMQTQMPAIS